MNYLHKELYNLLISDHHIFDFIRESALDGLWYWDVENPENEWMDSKFWTTLGYDPEQMPHKSSAWQGIIHQDDLKVALENFKKHCEDPNHPYDQIVRYKHKNGHTVWVRCRGMAIRDHNGKAIRLLGAHNEVSSLKKHEEILKRCNAAASIGYWEIDFITEKVLWSSLTKEILEVGRDFTPTINDTLAFFSEGKSKTSLLNAYQNAITNGKSYELELPISISKEKIKWVKIVGIPQVIANKCTQIYGTVQDIDLRKTNELKLREEREKLRISEESFRSNFEHAAIGMAILNEKGQWLKVNNKLCEIVGYTQEELRQLTFQDITFPADLDADLVLFQELMDGKRDHYQMEKRYFHKDGHIIYIILAVSIVRNNEGKILYVVSQIIDISELKEAKNKIQSLLKTSQEQNNRLKNFAHIVSHNLRSHSSNLGFMIDLLTHENEKLTEKEEYKLLKTASNNLAQTIQHLNEVAMIQTTLEENLQAISLSNSIKSAIENVAAIAGAAQVNIINEIKPDEVILGLPAYIDSIVLNLLTNGIKYRSENVDSYIKISSFHSSQFKVIVFEDNGKGIDLEQYGSQLFGMYKTFHRHPEARGIGLFITKSQIEALGGRIEVESEVNKGSKFKIYLKNEKVKKPMYHR
ncbi:PAS domain-containing sensor histidine kinase [Echinicola sp. 20G]|uniref:PAS domain-containing sensor histidine kinase n=1 Tax=Echinicola sp. 20G TaxID=2781961 RepID=UPI00191074A3|nr:PAS domain-containing sensor histidine kinase [Echinicola sp. 20G]